MPRRHVLTARQRRALLELPTDPESLRRHYTLADDDLGHIRRRRRPHNRLGFALQLCALRWPGRLLVPGEVIPEEVLSFLAAQFGMRAEDLDGYAVREETRHEHLALLRRIYGYRPFSGHAADVLTAWLAGRAELARSSEELVLAFAERCREDLVILPAVTMVERLCADALVLAERRIEVRIADRLDGPVRERLTGLLDIMPGGRLTRFVWLRRFESGSRSNAAVRLLDRLEFLRDLDVPRNVLSGIPVHRVARLRRHGERYLARVLRDNISEDRRLAVLAVCAVEWRAAIADALVETHERIVARTWSEAKRHNDALVTGPEADIPGILRRFANLGIALLEAGDDARAIVRAVSSQAGPDGLRALVGEAERAGAALGGGPLDHVDRGWNRFRRYAPRMLKALQIDAAPVSAALTVELAAVRDGRKPLAGPPAFVRANSKWAALLARRPADARLREVAAMFHMRDAFRSGDMWLAQSRRYGDMKAILAPAAEAEALAVPGNPEEWLADCRRRMSEGLSRLAAAVRRGDLAGTEAGLLRAERLPPPPPDEAAGLLLDLYGRLPQTRITDIMLEVDGDTGFTDAFPHLRTGAPCADRIGLLNVLLAEGINLGLRKMAEASDSHDYWALQRLASWHVEGDALDRALATVIEAQAGLPMARFWGSGTTASADGQFFPAARQGEAMNTVNARYGQARGVKAYTHLSDRFGPFATQAIPATAHEAPFIIDGLLMNETGRRIREQYADTGGSTDHVFAATMLLGYRFMPRIRDLPSRRLYVFDPGAVPKELRRIIGGRIREDAIVRNWPDILRLTATMESGAVQPSLLLRKLAAWPRRNELAFALREIGRVERTLFLIEWVLDPDMRRRAQTGLNKGESHHALKNALRIGRQGEIRDRTSEAQHYRIAGLNLLAAIVIYWNTKHLGEAVEKRRRDGLETDPGLLAHTSPLGWGHILLTGEYRWPDDPAGNP